MRAGQVWWLGIVGAAAAAAPLCAQAPAASTATAVAPEGVTPEIDRFYFSRNNPLIWFGNADGRAAAGKLPRLLRQAEIDGFADGPALAATVEAAIARGQPGDDRILSAAWVRYVQTLKAPVAGVHFGDPALAVRVPAAEPILADARRAPSLAAHVEEIAAINPIYSALRDAARNSGAERDPRVLASLERLRLVPASGRAILVDAASAQLWMLENGRPVDSMKVIVGKKKSPTPLLAATIHYITFNPYWNLPDDVARANVAPLVLKRGVKYLKNVRYVTADGFGKDAALVDAAGIDWKAVSKGEAPVYLRQLPGTNNMMGAMKFGFVNDFDIFLHDTPRKALFAKADRTLSMGCIRLEHADRLARWLLGREPEAPGPEPEQHVQLERGVPVYVSYLTAAVEDGRLVFADDVYGLDPKVETVAEAAEATPATD